MKSKTAIWVLPVLAINASAVSAFAGFESWTAEVEEDPFSKASSTVVDYMETIRSGVIIFCKSTEHAARIRIIPGYDWKDAMTGFQSTVQIAIDGELVYTGEGYALSVGNNLAAVQVDMERAATDQFVAAFKAAKKQIAIKDGMSDGPQLLPATGSTKAGAALEVCLTAP